MPSLLKNVCGTTELPIRRWCNICTVTCEVSLKLSKVEFIAFNFFFFFHKKDCKLMQVIFFSVKFHINSSLRKLYEMTLRKKSVINSSPVSSHCATDRMK